MAFLKYNNQTREIEFAESEYAILKPFRDLIANRHGVKFAMEGDSHGKFKKYAFAELGLIWWTNSHVNVVANLGKTKAQLVEEGIVNFELPVGWKPDRYYMNAEEEFKRWEDTVEIRNLKTLKRSFHVAERATRKLTSNIELSLNKDLDDTQTATLFSNLKLLTDLAVDIPKKLEKIKEIETQVKREIQSRHLQRGKQPVSSSMKRSDASAD